MQLRYWSYQSFNKADLVHLHPVGFLFYLNVLTLVLIDTNLLEHKSLHKYIEKQLMKVKMDVIFVISLTGSLKQKLDRFLRSVVTF